MATNKIFSPLANYERNVYAYVVVQVKKTLERILTVLLENYDVTQDDVTSRPNADVIGFNTSLRINIGADLNVNIKLNFDLVL